MSLTLPVTNIQRFSVHDGPGIRTTVFLKGCPLRCVWCHNPETKRRENELFFTDRLCIGCGLCAGVCPAGVHSFRDGKHLLDRTKCLLCGACADACPTTALELCAKEMTPEEILKEVLRDAPFYRDGGGVTLSGGEPTLHGEKTLALLRAAKEAGLHTALETCGYFPEAMIPGLLASVDLFLYDVKDTDPDRHARNTGVSNERILSNLKAVDAGGGESVMRCVMVKSVNMTPEHLSALAGLWKSLSHCRGIELLPYHAMGGSKSERLGRENDGRADWVPSKEEIRDAKDTLRALGAKVVE
ncbi:MAG: glycyl-radical enzyme activating protein [Clostridia bacterium]|nr:glycyl-radical enzyme activating protein [Clostridia bacterium]